MHIKSFKSHTKYPMLTTVSVINSRADMAERSVITVTVTQLIPYILNYTNGRTKSQ